MTIKLTPHRREFVMRWYLGFPLCARQFGIIWRDFACPGSWPFFFALDDLAAVNLLRGGSGTANSLLNRRNVAKSEEQRINFLIAFHLAGDSARFSEFSFLVPTEGFSCIIRWRVGLLFLEPHLPLPVGETVVSRPGGGDQDWASFAADVHPTPPDS